MTSARLANQIREDRGAMNQIEIAYDDGGAEFSTCRGYRYRLWRAWGDGPRCVFIMHNPSTADEHKNDPTNLRCIDFARRWGYDGVEMLNLFALRTANPKVVYKKADAWFDNAEGPHNEAALRGMADKKHPLYVFAYGRIPIRFQTHAHYVLQLFTQFCVHELNLQCLGKNKNGSPRHPLYLKKTTNLIPFLGVES